MSLKSGLSFVRNHDEVGGFLLLVFLTAFLGAPVVSMLPALVKGILHREAASYSMLLSVFGCGAVAAAILIAAFDRASRGRHLNLISLFLLGITQASLAISKFPLAVSLVFLAGMLFVGTMVRLGTAIIQTTPDGFRGRVSAFQQILFRAGQPLGALAAGMLGKWLGIGPSFFIGGVLLTVCMAGLFLRQLRASS